MASLSTPLDPMGSNSLILWIGTVVCMAFTAWCWTEDTFGCWVLEMGPLFSSSVVIETAKIVYLVAYALLGFRGSKWESMEAAGQVHGYSNFTFPASYIYLRALHLSMGECASK